MSSTAQPGRHAPTFFWVLLAGAGTFALTMGARQSMGLFVGTLNTSTGLGLASISLAFAFGQLWWGLTQPLAGMVADRVGAGRVLLCGVIMVAIGTALVPFMHSTWGLVLAIGVLAAGGPELSHAVGGVFRLRLSHRLHRDAFAGSGGGLRLAGGDRRVVAGRDRLVQHRRQLRDGLGRRPLAHEVVAVAGVCGARRRG